MLKKIDDDYNPQKGKMKAWYSTLCSFAHTDPLNLLSQISTLEVPGETSIHYGATYNKDLFKTSAYALCLWAGISLLIIGLWVPEKNQWHTGRNEHPLFYMDFGDLALLIINHCQ